MVLQSPLSLLHIFEAADDSKPPLERPWPSTNTMLQQAVQKGKDWEEQRKKQAERLAKLAKSRGVDVKKAR